MTNRGIYCIIFLVEISSKKETYFMNSKKLVDALKHIPMQFLFLCLSGLIAILVMIIPSFIANGVMWFSGTLGEPLGAGSLVVAIIGILTSMIAMYAFSQKSGDDAAVLSFQLDKSNLSMNILYPIIITVVAVAAYTGLCFVFGFDYIAGAVKFLAPFMAKVPSKDFTNIPVSTRFIAFIIVTAPQIPLMFVGYIRAYKARLKSLGAVK